MATLQAVKSQATDVDSTMTCCTKSNYTLSARELAITSGDYRECWDWYSVKDPSGACVDVAELVKTFWLEIHGKFETSQLPKTKYKVSFIIMMKENSSGWENPVTLKLDLPNKIHVSREEYLDDKRTNEWLNLHVGEFTADRGITGPMDISMFCDSPQSKEGLVVKGVRIQRA